MRKTTLLSILLLIVFSCFDGSNDNEVFSLAPDSKQDISITNLSLECILLDSIPSSYAIESGVINEDKVYFLDTYLCEMNIFSTNGKFVEKKLGSGRAKNETDAGRIAGSALCQNNKLFFYDPNGGYHLYDKKILKEDYFRISFNRNLSRKEKNPENNPINYTDYYGAKTVCRNYKNFIYFNAFIGLHEFGYSTHTDEYFTRAGSIIELDLKEKKLTKVLAKGYPESYTKNAYDKLPFMSANFDIDKKGIFYISYEADPYIYIYDNNFKNIACYGLEGKDMKVDYTKFDPSKGKFYNFRRKEKQDKGHYTWLEYEDKTNTLFRSYQKGGENKKDGLQIYREGVLIGDIEVPKSLRVMDYIPPYYYSYIIADEETERMEMYRFKLE